MRNPQKAISALGLLLTCMYTGKEGDRPSGLFQEETVDTPTDDILLVALERVTALFDRFVNNGSDNVRLSCLNINGNSAITIFYRNSL